MMDTTHFPFVREAIALAEAAAAKGDEPFGALLMRDGVVLLRAENSVHTGHDITNHAEMNLVRLAVAQYDSAFLKDCTLYTSTEPCAMCAGAIYWSRIGRVVFACPEERLRAITQGTGLNLPCREVLGRGGRAVEVIGPVLEEEAAAIHEGYGW
jgi:tRNA(Arg) A34 adenosine deaminase TadA